MKKKINIKELFGTTLDNDVALNNMITVQSKFKLCPEPDVVFNAIMEHMTNCKIMYFNYFVYPHKMKKFMDDNAIYITKNIKIEDKITGSKSSKSIKSLETFKVAFCRVYGLTSRQYNSIDFDIKGLIKSNKTLMTNRVDSFEDQLNKKLDKQNKLKGQIDLLSISHAVKNNNDLMVKSLSKKEETLFKLSQDIQKKQSAIDNLNKKINDEKVSVCFGDKKVLKRLSSLYNDSNYDHGKYKNTSPVAKKSYQNAYRKLWKDSRFNQFFLLGSKDETNGNSSCVFSKQSESLYSIRISIPPAVIAKLSLTCKYLIIDNINFRHNEKEILNCFALNSERKQKEKEYNEKIKANDPSLINKDGEIITKSKYLEDVGAALSFRFIKDTFDDPNRVSTDWRILVTTGETIHQKAIVSKSNGVIGIDINNDHFALAEINRHKQLVKAFNIDFGFSDCVFNTNKTIRKEAILKSVKKIIEYAVETRKPIVIEQLDFKRKKALLKEENTLFSSNAAKKKNRILSSFSYSMIIDTIKQQAYRNGIAVYEVNPAYTSQIGWVKYAKQYGISRHMAAAYVIARRTYAIEELFQVKEQIIVKNEIRTIPLLVDRGNCETYFEYCKRNLFNFQKRQVREKRGKKDEKSTQCSSGSVIPILPLNS